MGKPELYRESRPWGGFAHLTKLGSSPTVKRIWVHRGMRNSLQRHRLRHEHWFIESGVFEVTIGKEVLTGYPGDDFWVPLGTAHRFKGLGEANVLTEVSYGTFDENDNERLEDDFGRVDCP